MRNKNIFPVSKTNAYSCTVGTQRNRLKEDSSFEHTSIWATTLDFQQCGLCNQQSLRSACAYAQSDQSIC